MFGEEIQERLTDLIASQFFSHSRSKRPEDCRLFTHSIVGGIAEFWNYTKRQMMKEDGQQKSPEPGTGSGLHAQSSVSRHRRFI
jgi:hypothetical protein